VLGSVVQGDADPVTSLKLCKY